MPVRQVEQCRRQQWQQLDRRTLDVVGSVKVNLFNILWKNAPQTNLHVMAELEVRRECQRLSHSDITPSLEHHHRYWATWQSIADDELSDNIQTNLLVGDGLNHANGDDIDKG